MVDEATFHVLPFQRRSGELLAMDPIDCGGSEDFAYRRGRSMMHRVAGLVFFRVDTSASGDQWTEVEVLSTVGEVPASDAA